ncbi:hypothetical protein C0Q16_29740, partial [Klebsiella pneumoniae]
DNQGEGIRLGESVGGQFDTSLRHPLAWARCPASLWTIRARGSGLANPSAASSTLPCATRWPGRGVPR